MAEQAENKGSIYEFGRFVLDSHERILLADGKPVHLTDKVFDTLLFLIENNGRLLTKEEMMAAIWEETFVEESNLAKNISRLRKILGADGQSPIETLPKHGYRFTADVREIDRDTNLLVRRRLRVKITRTTENDEELKIDSDIQSLAVLPFLPLNVQAEDDFFGIGITDALITQLSRAGQFPVRSTSSILKYNAPGQNAISAASELQVDAILEGKFQRLNNKMRLTVQLLHRRSGAALWAESFNAEIEDIFAVQDEIARRVVGALTEKLSGEAEIRLKKRDTENVEAYQEYLKGRFYWNKRTLENHDKALACYQKAIDIDPLYALAYAGLADVYNMLPMHDGFAPSVYFPKAKAAALKALAIDKNLAEAHAALGLALLHCDWNFSGAEVSYRQAIKLNPNYAAVYQLLGSFLCRVERIGEAVIALKKALELDPLSPMNAVWLAEVLRHCGETDASIDLHLDTLKTFPDFFPAHYHLAFSYLDRGDPDKAAAHCEKAVGLTDENSLSLSLKGILLAAGGNMAEVEKILHKLLRTKNVKYISGANIASVYAALGKPDEAINWLEIAFDERDSYLTWIKFDREFQDLRQNPRFQNLLEKIGLSAIEVKNLPDAPPAPVKTSSKLAVLAIAVLSVLLIAVFVFYFRQREKPVRNVDRNESDAVRLTDNPEHESHPRWTKDGRIRFFRIDADRQSESWIMNDDGTNQTVARDFPSLKTGIWSPDGRKVIFYKPNDKNVYLADADGANEIVVPFPGNLDWSADSKEIVYQKTIEPLGAEIYVYSLDTGTSRSVSNHEAFDADPNFSPDGKQIVFISSRDGNNEIYSMNRDGGDVRRLTDHPAEESHPVFSPDGTQIAFTSDRENENADVYLINADGSGGALKLTDWKSNETVEPGCWSPDGTRIAFYSDRNGKDDVYAASAEAFRPRLVLADASRNLSFPSFSPDGEMVVYQAEPDDKSGELRVYDLETKQGRLLIKSENADLAPAFSPDGRSIAFQYRIEGSTEICLIKPDGSDLKNLTGSPLKDTGPAWSPDGRRIVFTSNRDGNTQVFALYTMNADGSDQRRIFYNGTSSFPSWSPDGRRIVFANDKEDNRSGNFEIFVIEPETGEPEKRLTFRRRFDTQPIFSPDGRRIAFVSETDGNSEIYVMNRDGTGLLRLTRNRAEDLSPHWSPDGKKIIFSSNREGKSAIYEILISDR